MYISTTLLSAATAFTGLALAAPYPAATGYPRSTWQNTTGHPSGPGSHSPGSYINQGLHPVSSRPGSYHGPAGPGSHVVPAGPGGPGSCLSPPGTFCMSDADAQDAADIFRLLIQNYSDELALAALTEDFVDYSSAVNIIINGGGEEPKFLPGPTFSGRQEFMDGQGSQPKIPFQQLKIWHGCDHVSMRWLTKRSAKGQATETDDEPVVGNVIIETVQAEEGAKYNIRIKTIYSEFNAAAWMVNLGIFTPVAPLEPPSKRSISASGRGNMI